MRSPLLACNALTRPPVFWPCLTSGASPCLRCHTLQAGTIDGSTARDGLVRGVCGSHAREELSNVRPLPDSVDQYRFTHAPYWHRWVFPSPVMSVTADEDVMQGVFNVGVALANRYVVKLEFPHPAALHGVSPIVIPCSDTLAHWGLRWDCRFTRGARSTRSSQTRRGRRWGCR